MSRFIRWITKSPFSHAWIAFYDVTLGQRMVMQAEAWGYEVRPWKRWSRENIWKYEFVLPYDAHADSAVSEISKYLGSDYDYKSAILLGIKNWIKKWLKKPLHSPGKLMCSEAVIRFLGMTSLGNYGLDPELSAPEMLLEKMEVDNRLTLLPL